MIRCPECKSKNTVSGGHVINKHSYDTPYQCNECGYKFMIRYPFGYPVICDINGRVL